MDYKLSPSDLTYLWEGCKACFYLKVKLGIDQPSIPIPGIFSKIANLQKNHYSGKRTEDFCKQLPPGVVQYGEKWVKSRPIEFGLKSSGCYVSGRFDVVIAFDDKSYGVIDFKTADPRQEKTELYSRQLHAYAYALENPAPQELELAPVRCLGLLYFSPSQCEVSAPGVQNLSGPVTWAEVERRDGAFLDFLREVVGLLDAPKPEDATCQHCEHCKGGLSCQVARREKPCRTCVCTCCAWCIYRAWAGTEGKRGAPVRPSAATAEKRGRAEPEAASRTFEPPREDDEGDLPGCPKCSGPMRLRTGRFGEFWSCQKFPECRGTRNVAG